jgi:hypothetical protein
MKVKPTFTDVSPAPVEMVASVDIARDEVNPT